MHHLKGAKSKSVATCFSFFVFFYKGMRSWRLKKAPPTHTSLVRQASKSLGGTSSTQKPVDTVAAYLATQSAHGLASLNTCLLLISHPQVVNSSHQLFKLISWTLFPFVQYIHRTFRVPLHNEFVDYQARSYFDSLNEGKFIRYKIYQIVFIFSK